jgi:hypothetical protein
MWQWSLASASSIQVRIRFWEITYMWWSVHVWKLLLRQNFKIIRDVIVASGMYNLCVFQRIFLYFYLNIPFHGSDATNYLHWQQWKLVLCYLNVLNSLWFLIPRFILSWYHYEIQNKLKFVRVKLHNLWFTMFQYPTNKLYRIYVTFLTFKIWR